MIKLRGLLIIIICTVILTGCSKPQEDTIKRVINNNTPNISKSPKNMETPVKENAKILPVDLNTEEGIRDYLQGDWVYDAYYRGDLICKMKIDKDLNVHLSFENSYSNAPKGDYSGKIKLDRFYANQDEAPDLICIELKDMDNSSEDFLYMHRTIYDGKRVMSWFFAGNGNSIFELEDVTGEFASMSDELIFEKVTGEQSQLEVYKDGGFYAIYWGKGANGKSIWLDDLDWIAAEEYDYDIPIPNRLTWYENDLKESILYNIVPEQIGEILGDELTEGIVYFVQTDEEGNIVDFISADRKRWLEGGSLSPEDKARIIDIIENGPEVIQEYLRLGMTIELDGGSIELDNEDCYYFALGTQHEGYFVQEIHGAVQAYSQQIYILDIINDVWEALEMNE